MTVNLPLRLHARSHIMESQKIMQNMRDPPRTTQDGLVKGYSS